MRLRAASNAMSPFRRSAERNKVYEGVPPDKSGDVQRMGVPQRHSATSDYLDRLESN